MAAFRIIGWMAFTGWVLFWSLLLIHSTEASAPSNEDKLLTPKQMWCAEQGGEFNYRVTKTYTIPCLTRTHAIFNDAETLVEYMMKYQQEFGQVPALYLKQ